MPTLIRSLFLGTLLFTGLALEAQEPSPAVVAVPVPSASSVSPRSRFSFGTGIEVRGQQEINPQYVEARMLPQFFMQARFFPYSLTLEGGYEQRETNTGPMSVATKSAQIGIWGRYEFGNPYKWSPFLGLGVGASFDTVNLNYGDGMAAKSYRGRRDYVGAGAGISHVLWGHFLNELEAKAVLIEDRRDIAWSAIYRVGFIY